VNEVRPDRCILVLVPADRPEEVVKDADLAAHVAAGRRMVAFWKLEAVTGGREFIAILLGPIPVEPTLAIEGLKRPEGPVQRWMLPPFVWPFVIFGSALAIVLVVAWLAT
jgi:hypothetical protein